jgi:glutaredoxin
MEVRIWTLPDCKWCVKAKKLIEAQGWDYVELSQKYPGYPTVPYIQIEGEGIGGFTELAGFLRKRIS